MPIIKKYIVDRLVLTHLLIFFDRQKSVATFTKTNKAWSVLNQRKIRHVTVTQAAVRRAVCGVRQAADPAWAPTAIRHTREKAAPDIMHTASTPLQIRQYVYHNKGQMASWIPLTRIKHTEHGVGEEITQST